MNDCEIRSDSLEEEPMQFPKDNSSQGDYYGSADEDETNRQKTISESSVMSTSHTAPYLGKKEKQQKEGLIRSIFNKFRMYMQREEQQSEASSDDFSIGEETESPTKQLIKELEKTKRRLLVKIEKQKQKNKTEAKYFKRFFNIRLRTETFKATLEEERQKQHVITTEDPVIPNLTTENIALQAELKEDEIQQEEYQSDLAETFYWLQTRIDEIHDKLAYLENEITTLSSREEETFQSLAGHVSCIRRTLLQYSVIVGGWCNGRARTSRNNEKEQEENVGILMENNIHGI